MKTKQIEKTITLFFLLVMAGQPTLYSQTGEELYKENCMDCHSIGQGDLVGPDLMNVHQRRTTDWIMRFIRSSDEMIRSGDEVARSLYEKYFEIGMQDYDFSPAQMTDLVNYMIASSGGEIASPESVEPLLTEEERSELIPAGINLFRGTTGFANGGVSCLACHHVTYAGMEEGGDLAINLTKSYSKFNGDAGLAGFIKKPSSAVMASAYAKHPLTDAEMKSLVAFLSETDLNGVTKSDSTSLFIFGIFVFCLLFIIIMLVWREGKDSVNAGIIRRQLKVNHT